MCRNLCKSDRMELNDAEYIPSQMKTASETAYYLYFIPLGNLLEVIMSDNLDGQVFLRNFVHGNTWIKDATGWSDDEIYQIEELLLQHVSWTKNDFISKVDRTNITCDITKNIMQNIVKINNVEIFCYHIKNDQNISRITNVILDSIRSRGIEILSHKFAQNL